MSTCAHLLRIQSSNKEILQFIQIKQVDLILVQNCQFNFQTIDVAALYQNVRYMIFLERIYAVLWILFIFVENLLFFKK